MPQMNTAKADYINALKAQIDAEIAARLLVEADAARQIHRRGFRAGDLRLLVQMDAASEVAEMPQMFRLPGAPPGIVGLVNRHGRVMPVMDLSVFFGTKRDRPAKGWLLTCGRGDEAIGLVIDTLPERKKFVPDEEFSLAGVTHPIAAHAKAAYREGQDIWIDVDFEAFFVAVLQVEPAPI